MTMGDTWDMDGFDDYASADLLKWFAAVAGTVTIASGGRNGSRLVCAPYSYARRLVPGGPRAEAVASFVLRASTLAADTNFFSFAEANGDIVYFHPMADGSIQVRRPATGARTNPRDHPGYTLLGATVPGVLSVNTDLQLELRLKVSATVGEVEIHSAGTRLLYLTGLNTKLAGWSDIDRVNFIACHGVTMSFDDYAIGSAFEGDTTIDFHVPLEDVQAEGFAPTAGSDRFAMVDDHPPDGATSQIVSEAIGDRATFRVEAFKTPGAAILARQIAWVGKRSAGATASIGGVLTHAGSDADGAGQPLTDADLGYQQIESGCGEAEFNADRYGIHRAA